VSRVTLEMQRGETFAPLGSLNVTLTNCRYPAGNPAGERPYAELEYRRDGGENRLFGPADVASAPQALSALGQSALMISAVIRCNHILRCGSNRRGKAAFFIKAISSRVIGGAGYFPAAHKETPDAASGNWVSKQG